MLKTCQIYETAKGTTDIQVCLGGANEGSELTLVLAADILDGEDGGGLLVDDRAETRLAFDNNVWDTHLAAKRGEEDNELDGVDIVGDDDERRLLGLNESNAVVQAVLDKEGLLLRLGLSLLLLSGGLGGSLEASLLLLLRLGAVLVQELEQLSSSVLVESVGELSDGRGDLETLVEDNLLALKANIFGPLDEASQVGLGLDILAYYCNQFLLSFTTG